jgi:predicted ribonuclease YlaK
MTRMVFTADLNQVVSTPYLDSMINALDYLISRFINERIFCYLNLKDSFRSRLAERSKAIISLFVMIM